jgi:putative ABC transport system permease protein
MARSSVEMTAIRLMLVPLLIRQGTVMASPRWHKVWGDLRLSRSRTILVVLSISIGVFAVVTLLTARTVLQNAVDDSFDVANPASAVLMTDPFDSSLVEAVQELPEIADAEGRTLVDARLKGDDDTWLDLNLHAMTDFNDIRIDRIVPEEGAWPPASGTLLLERLSRDAARVSIGDLVLIETPDGMQHTLTVDGVVYDPGQVAPGLGDGRLSGYVTQDTLVTLGQPAGFNQLHLLAENDPRDLQQGEIVAGLARDQVLEPNGVTVSRIAVQDTPRYHSADLGDALFLILGLMGGLVLLLGIFLVINTVSALLAQQTRQIGMMKAIGAQRRQIAGLYLTLVLAYGLLAVVVAMPLSVLAAMALAGFVGGMLNLDVTGPWLPPAVVALGLALGLLVPLLAALVPVMRGTRVTVREATTSYGLSDNAPQDGPLFRAIERLRGMPRPVLLSLRNTFRRRGRLALTLITLTLGGTIFASVATVQSSLGGTFDEMMQYTNYDVEVTLRQSEPADAAIVLAESVPGVEQAEGWISTNASRMRPDGAQNSNIWVVAPPVDSELIRPTLIEGRWFEPGEGEALVVNIDFQRDESDVHLGDVVTLRVEGQELNWPVVGIATSQLMGPVVYAPHEPFSRALGMDGAANRIVLVTTPRDDAGQADVAQLVDEQLRAGGYAVVQAVTQSDLRGGTESVFNILVVLLLFVGIMLVAVGSLGLMGAMSLNVIERTREIGVMRAIGASNGMVARIVIVEGLVVGLLSWLLGGMLALPLSWGLSYAIGVAFVQAPLAYSFSAVGLLLWLALVLLLSVLASVMPARSAWRLSVREVLAYE